MDLKKYFDVTGIKGQTQVAIARETAATLQSFCDQEPEFAQAIEQSGKAYQECLDNVCKGIGRSISDFEVYARAVKFYFSTATVRFNMIIELSGNNESASETPPPITVSHSEENKKAPEPETVKPAMSLSLDDILDF